MDVLERLFFFSVGCGIGFVLGYVVRSLKEIKEELDEVDDIVKHNRSDSGFVRNPILLDVVLVLALIVTVWAAFASQAATNNFKESLRCNSNHYLELTKALEQRDKAIALGTRSEINLWRSYERLYAKAAENPEKIEDLQRRLNSLIIKHRERLKVTQEVRNKNPYPNPEDLLHCRVQ